MKNYKYLMLSSAKVGHEKTAAFQSKIEGIWLELGGGGKL